MSTTAHFSITEYDRIVNTGALHSRRLELIQGEIREMSPIGPIHEDIVDLLNEWSVMNAKDVRVRIQQSIGLPGLDAAPEPDVVWVVRRNYRNSRPLTADVLLIVEVAESSLAYDLNEKAKLYANAEVAEYWVVDIPSNELVVHRDPTGNRYTEVNRVGLTGQVSPLSRPDISLSVRMLFPTDD